MERDGVDVRAAEVQTVAAVEAVPADSTARKNEMRACGVLNAQAAAPKELPRP